MIQCERIICGEKIVVIHCYNNYEKFLCFSFVFLYFFSKTMPVITGNFKEGEYCNNRQPQSRFIYLRFYVAFNTVQVISPRVVGRVEETSTYSSLGFCTVNCRPTASNYQLSHLGSCRKSHPSLRGGRQECYHSATVAPTTKSNL